MEKRKNIKLNLLKGFACIGVVCGHITFPGLFGLMVLRAVGYTVPVFFMIAGYYAFGKCSTVIKRRLMKIVKIFIIAYALFFLYRIAGAIANHNVNIWLANHFNWKTPIKYLCFCTIDFAIPLWYLIAMIEIYILWFFVVKKGIEDVLVKITPILFVLQILLTAYCESRNLAWFWKINFVTRGLPWFLLGYYLNTPKADELKKISTNKLYTLAVIGCVIAVIPTAFDLPIKFNVVGYIPYAFGLFVLAIKNPSKSICKPMEFIGENLSLYIYILHIIVSGVLFHILKRLGVNINSDVFLWCRPIIAVIATIAVSCFVFAVSKKRRLRAE